MELDPVEVLLHLKALGYENVDPHLLQKFMKDLRKLIKYEKHKSKLKEKENINLARNSENKVKPIELTKNKCQNACCNINKSDVFERLSKPRTNSKLCSKAVSTVGVQTDLPHKNIKNSQILKKKPMDPVSLNQYYQNVWQMHKVPGEKNHDHLRWQIRQMMNHK